MTLSEKQRRFTWLVSCLIDWLYNNGYEAVIGEVYRTQEQHNIYLAKKLSKVKKSHHMKCLAADISIFKDGIYLTKTPDYERAGLYWESLDPECVWGGRFGDNPDTPLIEGWDGNHFQYTR